MSLALIFYQNVKKLRVFHNQICCQQQIAYFSGKFLEKLRVVVKQLHVILKINSMFIEEYV